MLYGFFLSKESITNFLIEILILLGDKAMSVELEIVDSKVILNLNGEFTGDKAARIRDTLLEGAS